MGIWAIIHDALPLALLLFCCQAGVVPDAGHCDCDTFFGRIDLFRRGLLKARLNLVAMRRLKIWPDFVAGWRIFWHNFMAGRRTDFNSDGRFELIASSGSSE